MSLHRGDDGDGYGLRPVDSEHILVESDAEPIVEISGTQSSRIAIRLADTQGRRSQASYLIQKMYGWRGYSHTPMPDDPNRLTLVASTVEKAVATITVGFDSRAGLSVASLYPDEIAKLRAAGGRLCEFTRFAVDRSANSLELLAMVFHVVFLFAHRRFKATHLLAEVNPRHVRFYSRMLDFEAHGPERMCPRVGAPAVLLMLPVDRGAQNIANYAGRRDLIQSMRSLYPYFFSPQEEQALLERLLV